MSKFTFIILATMASFTLCAQEKSKDSFKVGPKFWYEKFVRYEHLSGESLYKSADAGKLAWAESCMLRSYIVMYNSTWETQWLDKLVLHADTIISNATDPDNDGYLDWRSSTYGDGGPYPYLVFDGIITWPMAQFVRLVKENPKQLSQYAAKAAVYRKFIETHIVPKWTDSKSHMGDCWVQLDAKTGYFKESEKMPGAFPKAKFDPLPYNQMAPYACMLWTMYDVNGNNAYRDKAGQMAQYLKDGMTINGDGYKWWYCNIPNPHMEDASHGNLDIDLAVESYNRGGAFKKEDMQRLANTLVEIMWNKSVESPQLSKTVDGTNKDPIYSANLNGWIRLTPFNKTVRIIAANYYKDFDLKGFNQAFSVARLVGAER